MKTLGNRWRELEQSKRFLSAPLKEWLPNRRATRVKGMPSCGLGGAGKHGLTTSGDAQSSRPIDTRDHRAPRIYPAL